MSRMCVIRFRYTIWTHTLLCTHSFSVSGQHSYMKPKKQLHMQWSYCTLRFLSAERNHSLANVTRAPHSIVKMKTNDCAFSKKNRLNYCWSNQTKPSELSLSFFSKSLYISALCKKQNKTKKPQHILKKLNLNTAFHPT